MTRAKVDGGRTSGLIALGLLVAVGTALMIDGPGFWSARAQDATPRAESASARKRVNQARSATISTGSCPQDGLGEVVRRLTNLTVPRGESLGQRTAAPVFSSFTNVPLSLDELLGEDHAITVQTSVDDETSIACGDIGGVLTESGDLLVGLREQERSRFAGVAYLNPAPDGSSTNISVFLTRRGAVGRAAATPEVGATPGQEGA